MFRYTLTLALLFTTGCSAMSVSTLRCSQDNETRKVEYVNLSRTNSIDELRKLCDFTQEQKDVQTQTNVTT